MLQSLYLQNEPPTETMQIFLAAIKKTWPDNQHFSSFDNSKMNASKNTPKPNKHSLFAFGKGNRVNLTEIITTNDTIITVDWVSFTKVLNDKKINNQHIHLASDLPTKFPWIKKIQKNSNTLIACSSTFIQEYLVGQGLPRDLLPLINPPYIDEAPQTKKSSQQSFMVGSVNSFLPGRGHETLIQAFHSSQELLPQIRVILVGEGPEKKNLQWLIDQLHLRSKVQLVSRQENYHRFLNNFDVLVAPQSEPAGWNASIIHALAKGVPVIASKVGCHQDIIEHGKTGLIFEPGNSSVLAQHLINLYNHPNWVKHYKESGPKAVAKKHSLDKFKSKTEKLLK